MMMKSEDTKKYPHLFWWLYYDLWMLQTKKPKVYEAYIKYSPPLATAYFSPPGWGPDGLTFGTWPWIKVENSMMVQCMDLVDENGKNIEEKIGDNLYVQRRVLPWYGYTVPKYGVDEIYIAEDLVTNAGNDSERDIVLEATVLHELIHWNRKKAFLDVYDETAPYAFEQEAYGKRIFRTWKSCYEQPYYKTK
jgi:Metallopeptidase toxin 3